MENQPKPMKIEFNPGFYAVGMTIFTLISCVFFTFLSFLISGGDHYAGITFIISLIGSPIFFWLVSINCYWVDTSSKQ